MDLRYAGSLLGLFLVVGCMAVPEPIQPTPTVVKNYEPGAPKSAGIGDAIFDVQAAVLLPSYKAVRRHDPGRSLMVRRPVIPAGERFVAESTLSHGSLVVRAVVDSADIYRLVTTPDGVVLGLFDGRKAARGGDWPTTPLLEPDTLLAGQKDSFRAQMIYSGLDGTTLRTAYREFSGDFIRPAFTQELQYDLSQDSTIAYKSIRIEVEEATNSRIRFRVVEDGGLEWLPVTVP